MSGWMPFVVDESGTLRLEVDGIVSEGHISEWYVQPMIDLIDEGPIRDSYRQMWNMPPTEAELDWWVRDGDEEWTFLPVPGPTP